MKTIVLGGGPAGLSAAYVLKKNNKDVIVIEKENQVGGISRTININGYRFDFGGHRFWTKKEWLTNFLKELMGDELINVPRYSKIYFNNKFFDYPLKPANSMFSLGIFKTMQILADYSYNKIIKKERKEISFEDWVVNKFGRIMYEIYFRPYTEKLWGIPCTQLSADWAAQRIKGMSLREAINNALFAKFKKNKIATLATEFLFPKLGIGRISERLAEGIDVKLNQKVKKIKHKNNKVTSIETDKEEFKGNNFISSIPINELVIKMNAPKQVVEAAEKLKYRDTTFVILIIDKESVTKDTWMYFPSNDIPFGRFHEPKNWSKWMSKEGKTSLVLEFFCNKGDKVWNEKDKNLIEEGIGALEKLNFIKRSQILDSYVIRVKDTYPIYEIGYERHLEIVKDYLKQFKNMQLIGRNGTFSYKNIDHVLEMGILAAKNLLGEKHNLDDVAIDKEYLEEKKLSS